MALRVGAAILLAALYGSVIGFCIYIAIHENSWIAVACGVVILAITVPEAIKAIRKNRQRKR